MEPGTRKFKQNDYIFRESEPGETMFLIKSGRVRIARRIDGRDVELGVLGPDEFFGEMALLTKEGRTGAAQAIEDTVLLEISEATFMEALRTTPYWIRTVFKSMAERLGRMNERLCDLTSGGGHHK